MRKKIILFSAIIAIIAAAVVLALMLRPEAKFDGDRISNPGRFALQFNRMNTADSETMALREGDALHVSWRIESGHADIAIGIQGEEPVYRADHRSAGDEADFYVEIPKAGAYTITVSARDAKGRIEFLKKE